MPERYSKIIFLVHPLFYPFFGQNIFAEEFDSFSYNRANSSLLGVYGKFILDAQKDPNSFFIVVLPAYERILEKTANPKLAEKKYSIFQRTVMNPFLEFVKSKLGDRLYITNFDPNEIKTTNPLLPKDFERIFKSKVRVNALGEYEDHCVERWSSELVETLQRKQIIVHFEVKHELSLPYYEDHSNRYNHDSLWNRLSNARRKRHNLKRIQMSRPQLRV